MADDYDIEVHDTLFDLIIKGDLDGIKEILNEYTPEYQRKYINSDTGYGSLLNIAVYNGNIDIIKYLIEKGADVNHIYGEIDEDDNLGQSTSLLDAILQDNLEIVKLLVENGATLSTPPSLHSSILHKLFSIDILKYLLEKGAQVDALDHERYTPLMRHIESSDINDDFLKVLLDAGANPNHENAYGTTALDMLLSENHIINIPRIKLLRKYGAEITPSIQESIDDGEIIKDYLDALNLEIKESWKGWTQSDANALDAVFGNPANFSACPVCLKYSVRQDGCMYMSHICTELGGLYNKNLYNVYKNDEGKIFWCTLCNRICLGHRHYKVSLYGNKAELGCGGDPFAKDCRPCGGGYPEKVQRFNQLRAHALELNANSKISASSAFNELTEEFWNAPLRREKTKIEGIIKKETFGNATNFPPNRMNNAVNTTNAPNIQTPATLVMPTLVEKGYNSISMNDDVPVLQFHHETTGGLDHKDSLIGVKTLVEQLTDRVKNFGDENFGYCITYPECKAKLYPQEIKPYVPDELYKEYKKKFNTRFKNRGGRRTRKRGGGLSFFGEATNATCLLKGGRRTRKRRACSKKTRKHRN